MWTHREMIIFVAGMQTFHTLSHSVLALSGTSLLSFLFITWTVQLKVIALIINIGITGFLYWLITRIR